MPILIFNHYDEPGHETYQQEHSTGLLRSEAAVHFFRANGITRFPQPANRMRSIDWALFDLPNEQKNEHSIVEISSCVCYNTE